MKIIFPLWFRRNFFIATSLLSVVVVLFCFYWSLLPPGDGSNKVLVDCVKGAPLARTADELERRGLIRSSFSLVWLARLKGEDNKVHAGLYRFDDGMTPSEILRKMVDGDVYAFRFAVPEGYSIHQLAEMLDGRKIHQKGEFLSACSDRALLDELKIPGPTVEGYLFPATYNITPGMKPDDTIRMMVKHFNTVCRGLSPLLEQGGRHLHNLVTLASLVEKEAVVPTEQPLIASVFLNRLKKGMRLQSDPTAVYGFRSFGGRVTHDDVMRLSPYNTYQISGLPPGPIGNPGAGSLLAVINPQKSSYLYFVAKKDGTHFFSTSLDQHNMAVKRYLKDQ